jgi:hypothetical protein
MVEEVVQNSGTPYFCFKDIDENRPSGSIKIRVETISYFLKRYREDMVARMEKQLTLEERLKEYEHKLREELTLSMSSRALWELPDSVETAFPILDNQPSETAVAVGAGR